LKGVAESGYALKKVGRGKSVERADVKAAMSLLKATLEMMRYQRWISLG